MERKRQGIWGDSYRPVNVAEAGGIDSRPYGGLSRPEDPGYVKIATGAEAAEMVAETLELEAERRRIRVEGPRPR